MENITKENNNGFYGIIREADTRGQQIKSRLNEPIPRDVISKRKAGNGIELDYLEGWYVINRLNEIFGQGNWHYVTEPPVKVYETTVTNKQGKTGRAVSYTALVHLNYLVDNQWLNFADIGAGKGIDYGFGLEADESAVKEAVTDGLKRCAKNLGMSMGLALYDKSREFVEERSEEAPRTPTPSEDQSRKRLDTLIYAKAEVAVKKGLTSMDEVKQYLKKEFNAENRNQLNDEQARQLLSHLDSILQRKGE